MRVGSKAWLRRWGVALLAAVFFASALGASTESIGRGDWDYFVSWALVVRESVVDAHEWPLWNPYHCGGMPVLDNFQSRIASPGTWLAVLLGPIAGLRVWALVVLALGFEGARRLARRLGAPRAGAWLAAIVTTMHGGVALRLGTGHVVDLGFLLLPWLWGSVLTMRERLGRGATAFAAWCVLLVVEGAFYPLVYGVLSAALFALVVGRRRHARRLVVGFVAAGAMLAFASAPVLLWGALRLLGGGPREVPTEHMPLHAIGEALFSREQPLGGEQVFHGQIWWWHEFGAYVGLAFGVACLIGLAVARRRGDRLSIALAFASLFFVAMAMGDVGPFSPWELLHRLPVFGAMRASGRALLVAVPLLALGLGRTLRHETRWANWVLVAVALDMVSVSVPILQAEMRDMPEALELEAPSGETFVQKLDQRHEQSMTRAHFTTMANDVRRHHGVLACYDPTPPERHATGKRPLVSLVGAGGEARIVRWSPGSITIGLSGVDGPALLVYDMNFAPGWRARDARPVLDHEGVVSCVVSPKDGEVLLEYAPAAPVFVFLVWLVGLGLAALVVARRWRRSAAPRHARERAMPDLGSAPEPEAPSARDGSAQDGEAGEPERSSGG